MNNKEKYTEKEWKKIASLLSGETAYSPDEIAGFREEDRFSTETNWNDMMNTMENKEVDVDKAWGNVYARIEQNGLLSKNKSIEMRVRLQTFIRIAASVIIILGLGISMLYLNKTGVLKGKIVVSAGAAERNKEVSLPDGSKVYLNRNSTLSYNKNLGRSSRDVTLKGEAYFEIKHDPSLPFIIDAGEASVKVLGTTFSVLTNNSNNDVEVFVKTGSVMLSNSSGEHTLVLEPGYIGTMNSTSSAKTFNENPNYLSWNTDLLVYNNTTLDIVLSDIRKVYNAEVVADDPNILKIPLTATFEKEPQDTIMKVLCTTFSLNLKKEGAVYHLSVR